MIISPATCHRRLQALLGSQELGAQTALLATPGGQLISCAVKAKEVEALPDEPWLEEPERIRLLLGLLSQWEEGESPRIECEVSLGRPTADDVFADKGQLGRLFVRSIRLVPAQPSSNPGSMASVRSPNITRFVLLVNGRSETSWADLELAVSCAHDTGFRADPFHSPGTLLSIHERPNMVCPCITTNVVYTISRSSPSWRSRSHIPSPNRQLLSIG